jgi:hypothetical protein
MHYPNRRLLVKITSTNLRSRATGGQPRTRDGDCGVFDYDKVIFPDLWQSHCEGVFKGWADVGANADQVTPSRRMTSLAPRLYTVRQTSSPEGARTSQNRLRRWMV